MRFIELIKRWRQRPLAEKRLLIEAACILAVARLAILFLRFRWIASFLGEFMAPPGRGDGQALKTKTMTAVSKAVRTMGQNLPWECKCLVQAITGKMMLRRRGIESTLYLGVAKDEADALIAHAWLKAGGQVIIGGEEMPQFTTLSMFT